MRILFLESHPMWIHGLPNGFRDLGHSVEVSGPISSEKLEQMIRHFQPELIFTMGWGPENSSLQKQALIREQVKKAQVPHIYWATEDPTHTKSFTLPFLKNVQPDFVFTICPTMVANYLQFGIKAAHLDFGYHPSLHCPARPDKKYRSKIAVVANAYPRILKIYPQHYRIQSQNILIVPLLKENLRIDFYGNYWNDMQALLGIGIPEEWIHGYLPYTEANKVYSSADIIIGLQNHPTQLTQRTYEILGSGGFLLTNNTPAVNRLFEPGQDLLVSSSPEETLQLVRYYLKHPNKRRLIQKKGKFAVTKYSYQDRAEYILKVLNEQGIFTGRGSSYKLEQIEASLSSQDKNHYTVCNGDTLWEISRRFGVSIEQIMNSNGLTSDIIYAGQLLNLQGINTQEKNRSSVLIFKGMSKGNNIALTYDAGGGAEGVPFLLEVLKKHAVKATFFLTGQWVEEHPDVAKAIVDDGHEIGNHSYSHPDLSQLGAEQITDEITHAEKVIKNLTQLDCRPLFRPPFGTWNRQVLEIAGENGYPYSIHWSLDTIDWQQVPADLIIQRVLDSAKPNDIVLMHSEYLSTAIASDTIISSLKARGFTLVPVSEML